MDKCPTTVVKGKVVSAYLVRAADNNLPSSLAVIVKDVNNESRSFQIPCEVRVERMMKFIAPQLAGEHIHYEAGSYTMPATRQVMGDYAFATVKTGRFAGCKIGKSSNL